MNMQEALYIVGGLRQSACIDRYNDAQARKSEYIQHRVNELCDNQAWCADQLISLVNAKSDALIDVLIAWHSTNPKDTEPRIQLEVVLATEARKIAELEWTEYTEALL